MGTATDVGSGVEVVNTFLSEMVTHFEQEGVPVQQVNGCHTQLTQPYLYGTLFSIQTSQTQIDPFTILLSSLTSTVELANLVSPLTGVRLRRLSRTVHVATVERLGTF